MVTCVNTQKAKHRMPLSVSAEQRAVHLPCRMQDTAVSTGQPEILRSRCLLLRLNASAAYALCPLRCADPARDTGFPI